MKAAFCLIVIHLVLVLAAGAQVRFGAPDDSFAPVVNGPVYALYVQVDGMVVIGGDFTEVNGVPCNRLARLSPDGTLDAGFASGAGADAAVRHLVYRPASDDPDALLDEAFFIAGDFTQVGGQPAAHLAKLRVTDGAADPAFDPGTGPDGAVTSLVAAFNGGEFLYVAGEFTTIDGAATPYLTILGDDGKQSPSMALASIAPNAPVRALSLRDSFLCLGGEFTMIGTEARPYFAMIHTESDPFVLTNDALAFDGPIERFALDDTLRSTSTLQVFGQFNFVNDLFLSGFADLKISSTGSGAQLNPNVLSVFGGDLTAATTYTTPGAYDVQLIVAGSFEALQGIPVSSPGKVVLDRSVDAGSAGEMAELDFDFDPGTGVTGTVHAVASSAGERIYLAGEFSAVDGAPRSNLARLQGSWLDQVPTTPSATTGSAANHDAVALVWDPADRVERYVIERRPAGGGAWEVAATSLLPYALDTGLGASESYEYRIVGENYNGQGAPGEVVSVTTLATPWTGAGTVDHAFTDLLPGTSGGRSLVELPDGRILLAGLFSDLPGAQSKYLVMLRPDGSFDPEFNPGTGPNKGVLEAVVQPDGKILLGGYFDDYDGASAKGICRIDRFGGLDPGFQSPITSSWNYVYGLHRLSDGRIVIGGFFDEISGLAVEKLAVLLPDGSLDPAFTIHADVSGSISDLVLLPDDSFLVDGLYSYHGARVRDYIRVYPDGTLDPEWVPVLNESYPYIRRAIADAAGRVYLLGRFTYDLEGTTYRNIARLRPDSSIDPGFTPPDTDDEIVQGGLSLDGRPIIYGSFQVIGGQVVPGVARLNLDGSLDEAFRSPEFFGRFRETVWYVPPELITTNSRNRTTLVDVRNVDGAFNESGFVRLLEEVPGSLDPPSGISASATSSSSILLEWSPVPRAFSAVIERSEDGVTWTTMATLASPIAAFHDELLAPGRSYHYRIHVEAGLIQSATQLIQSAAWTTFQQWMVDHGFPAETPPHTVPDGGVSSLLLSYALGIGPFDPATEAIVSFHSGDRFFFAYDRAREELGYEVQWSVDGVAWTAEGVDQGPAGQIGFASVAIQPEGIGLLRLSVREP